LVEIGLVVLEKKLFKEEVYGQRMDDGQWRIPIAHLSILLRCANKNENNHTFNTDVIVSVILSGN